MPIDPSIPIRAAENSRVGLVDIMRQQQERQYREQQMQMQQRRLDQEAQTMQRQQTAAGSLAELIGQRGAGGQIDTKSPAFQTYTQNDPQGALAMLKDMDADKRAAAKDGLDDLSAAVRWADSPDKWMIVQQHYGKFDPQLAAVPFEQREQALISLGQMGEYLKATEAPKAEIRATEPGGGLYRVRPDGVDVLVAPNDGSQPFGAPAQGGPRRVTDEASYNAVPPGAAYMAPDGTIRRKPGGPTGSQSGTFRPVGMAGETVTSTRRSAARNKAVGGVANSYHLSGRARDSIPPPGMSMAEYHRRLKALNPHLDVINEGDHVHMEPR